MAVNGSFNPANILKNRYKKVKRKKSWQRLNMLIVI